MLVSDLLSLSSSPLSYYSSIVSVIAIITLLSCEYRQRIKTYLEIHLAKCPLPHLITASRKSRSRNSSVISAYEMYRNMNHF